MVENKIKNSKELKTNFIKIKKIMKNLTVYGMFLRK